MSKRVKLEEWPEDGELHITQAAPAVTRPMSPSPFSFSFASASMGAKWEEIDDGQEEAQEQEAQPSTRTNKIDTRKLCTAPIIVAPMHVHIFGKTKMFLASAAKIASVDKKGDVSLSLSKSSTTRSRTPATSGAKKRAPSSKYATSKKRAVTGKKDGLGNIVFSLASFSPSSSQSSSSLSVHDTTRSSVLVDAAIDVKSVTKEARRTCGGLLEDDPIEDSGGSASLFHKKPPCPGVNLHAPITKAALRHFQFGCFSFAAVSPKGQEEASIIELPELACDKHRASLAALKHVLQLYLNYEHLSITTDSAYVADMVKKLSVVNGAADSMWISPTQKCADLLQQVWVLLRCRCILELNTPTVEVVTLKESAELRQLDQVVETALNNIHALAALNVGVSDLAEADVIMNDDVV